MTWIQNEKSSDLLSTYVVIILQSYIMMSNPFEYNPFNKLNMADGGSILYLYFVYFIEVLMQNL
jgi:hypothetical protein